MMDKQENQTEPKLTFETDDRLSRSSYANALIQIIDQYTGEDPLPHPTDNKSFVMAISASWGLGKSTFVKMLETKLESGDNLFSGTKQPRIIHYDAWENDFWDNAFEPLFDKITSGSDNNDWKRYESYVKILGNVTKAAINTVVNIDDIVEAIKDSKKNIDESKKTVTREFFPNYANYKKAIKEVQEDLQDYIQGNGKMLIVIDELDRCRPTFAVQTLEIVKHFFNIEGLVFLFSLDLSQLQHCIKTVYGSQFDAIGYLERFFDYTSLLPEGDQMTLLRQSLREYRLLPMPGKETSKHAYIDEEVVDKLFDICQGFQLSAREIKTVVSSFAVFYNLFIEKHYKPARNVVILYFFFLVMKYKKPVEFLKACKPEESEARAILFEKNMPNFLIQIEDPYQTFKNLVLENPRLSEREFQVCHENQRYTHLQKTKLDVASIEEDESLNYLLYAYDVRQKEKIRNYTVLEYIYRNLELDDYQAEAES